MFLADAWEPLQGGDGSRVIFARDAKLFFVIIGVSEGECEFFGTRQISALVRSLREEFDFLFF